jgi:hypothetical protein
LSHRFEPFRCLSGAADYSISGSGNWKRATREWCRAHARGGLWTFRAAQAQIRGAKQSGPEPHNIYIKKSNGRPRQKTGAAKTEHQGASHGHFTS